jgi:hypothetical protein
MPVAQVLNSATGNCCKRVSPNTESPTLSENNRRSFEGRRQIQAGCPGRPADVQGIKAVARDNRRTEAQVQSVASGAVRGLRETDQADI